MWHCEIHHDVFLFIPCISIAGDVLQTHCNQAEKTVFNCRVDNSSKVVSLCRSQNLQGDGAYLQYRFGKPGKIELEYPQQRENSLAGFRFSHYLRHQVDYAEVKFTNGPYEYAVFDNTNGEEDPANPLVEQGVSVGDVSLVCAEPVISALLSLEGIIACDGDSGC